MDTTNDISIVFTSKVIPIHIKILQQGTTIILQKSGEASTSNIDAIILFKSPCTASYCCVIASVKLEIEDNIM